MDIQRLPNKTRFDCSAGGVDTINDTLRYPETRYCFMVLRSRPWRWISPALLVGFLTRANLCQASYGYPTGAVSPLKDMTHHDSTFCSRQ
jgi:hypothetical protein